MAFQSPNCIGLLIPLGQLLITNHWRPHPTCNNYLVLIRNFCWINHHNLPDSAHRLPRTQKAQIGVTPSSGSDAKDVGVLFGAGINF